MRPKSELWKPNKWLAAGIGFLFQPLGMLYVVRVKLAIAYLIASLSVAMIQFYGFGAGDAAGQNSISLTWLLMALCAVHSFYLAKTTEISHASRPWFSRWFGLIGISFTFFAILMGTRVFLFEPFRIPANSMYPDIARGSHIIVSKIGFANYGTFGIKFLKIKPTRDITRGSVVVFDYPKDEKIQYIKRVIGLPGDLIRYQNKKISVNGRELPVKKILEQLDFEIYEETLDSVNYRIAIETNRPVLDGEYRVPEGNYFVMGDNRDNSNDSRFWGFLPEANLVGEVIYVF